MKNVATFIVPCCCVAVAGMKKDNVFMAYDLPAVSCLCCSDEVEHVGIIMCHHLGHVSRTVCRLLPSSADDRVHAELLFWPQFATCWVPMSALLCI